MDSPTPTQTKKPRAPMTEEQKEILKERLKQGKIAAKAKRDADAAAGIPPPEKPKKAPKKKTDDSPPADAPSTPTKATPAETVPDAPKKAAKEAIYYAIETVMLSNGPQYPCMVGHFSSIEDAVAGINGAISSHFEDYEITRPAPVLTVDAVIAKMGRKRGSIEVLRICNDEECNDEECKDPLNYNSYIIQKI